MRAKAVPSHMWHPNCTLPQSLRRLGEGRNAGDSLGALMEAAVTNPGGQDQFAWGLKNVLFLLLAFIDFHYHV